jgi:hypothetical protein
MVQYDELNVSRSVIAACELPIVLWFQPVSVPCPDWPVAPIAFRIVIVVVPLLAVLNVRPPYEPSLRYHVSPRLGVLLQAMRLFQSAPEPEPVAEGPTQ